MAEAIQQPLQAGCGLSRVWVPLVQLDLDQSPTIENQVSGNSENILNESRGPKGSKWSVREHPVGDPRVQKRITSGTCGIMQPSQKGLQAYDI
jgi:hypothetical protein